MADTNRLDEDLLLLVRIYAGDLTALGVLYDRHAPLLYSVCNALLSNEREAAEVVRRTWAMLSSRTRVYGRRDGPVAYWLMMMARHEALEILRSRPAPQEAEALVAGAAPAPPAAQALDPEAVAALGRLPALQRQALEAAFFRGFRYPRLAAHLELDLPAAENIVRLALDALGAGAPAKEPA